MITSALLYSAILVAQLPSGMTELFDHTTHDFGNVPHGSMNVHRFTLKNRTGSTVRVSGVSSSCHCATPKALTNAADPGEELIVEVLYDAGKFFGPRSMTISVNFQEPTYETVALRVSGNSRGDVVFRPAQIDFGVVGKGAGATRTATIEYTGNADWRISEALPGQDVTAKVEELHRRPGQIAYQVTVALKPETAPGGISDVVQLKTNDPNSPVLQLRATGTIEAALVASPNHLHFGSLKIEQKAVRKVLLTGKEPFEIQWVKRQPEGIKVLCTEGSRKIHLLQIEVEPRHSGKIDQMIEVKTNLPGDDPLTLPVVATVDP